MLIIYMFLNVVWREFVLRIIKLFFLSFLWLVLMVQPEEAERYWFAFVLYSLKRLTQRDFNDSNREKDAKGFSLCQMLRAAKLK